MRATHTPTRPAPRTGTPDGVVRFVTDEDLLAMRRDPSTATDTRGGWWAEGALLRAVEAELAWRAAEGVALTWVRS